MLSLRTHLIICAALLAALIGCAIIGAALQKAGVVPPSGVARYVAAAFYFLLFIAFGLSAIPVMVKVVLGAQVAAGNTDVAAIAAAVRRQNMIIYALWGLIGTGTLIAVPAALLGGAFGDAPQRALNRWFAGPNRGTLVVRPDMTLDEMVRQSSLKIDLTYARSSISANTVFDFVVAGTAITFRGARYYYMTTYTNDHTRIRAVNVGTSSEKAPRTIIDSADTELRARLAADGWLTGHEVYRTEQDQTLHGGATEGPEGRHWLKDDMVLTISRNRMDEAKRDEDPATSGQWIQYVDLWPAKEYPGFDRMVFQPPKPSTAGEIAR